MNPKTEREYAVRLGLAKIENGKFKMESEFIKSPDRVFLPTLSATKMKGYITSVGDTGRIFFKPNVSFNFDKTEDRRQYMELSTRLQKILKDLALSNVERRLKEKDLVIYQNRENRLRGEIIGTNPCVMRCLDTGENILPDFSQIRHFKDDDIELKNHVFDYPPQCFEISLLETRPSISASKNRRWSTKAVQELRKCVHKAGTNDNEAEIHIFSITDDDVVSAELFVNGKCINDELKLKGLAVEGEESCMSKLNHQTRMDVGKSLGHTFPGNDFARKTINRHVEFSPDNNICHRSHVLKGPYSPLECKVTGLSSNFADLDANIQDNSVNQIILNDGILDNVKKYYVAANVSLSKSGKLNVSEVSKIPQITGLAAILAMIFSPDVQLHRNETKTKFKSFLCGLGFDFRANFPYFAERDVAMELDFDLSPDHLKDINHIRLLFSAMLHTESGQEYPEYDDKTKVCRFVYLEY